MAERAGHRYEANGKEKVGIHSVSAGLVWAVIM